MAPTRPPHDASAANAAGGRPPRGPRGAGARYPQQTVSPTDRWESRLAAVAEALDRPLSDVGREALQAEIEAVYREADALSVASARVRDRAAELARRWHLVTGTPAAATPVRVDHLGASTYVEKGWSRLAQGDASGAEEAFRLALALAPGSPDTEVLLAWALGQRGRGAEAHRLLAGVLAQAPHHPLALATLGYVAMREGDLERAEALLRRATDSGADRKAALYAWFHLGVIARRRGALADAEVAFREALKLGPNLLQAWYELGRARWEAQHRPEAVSAWRAGVGAGKFNPWGRRCGSLLEQVEAGGAPVFEDA
jgi:Flp pilus assembly protein TadD